ncbi:NAD-dependent succinate-semialdehyde dehydrogenase [Roseibium sp. CAU 1637]|uniref:NAD-dependent succinate-semialdehyde dehydrogenase n=1 Tax=Roseibium limicola TaxID=2816037 RepID=A0A939EKR6_9HYPH|nr:NAD-dependent succinate-semialdehyde dehydrogenase [Roseibium limicola]MBO0344369.1 NAD-dependent succinate-semialdehyde dehydrogenase [Roseibium limicola]
MLATKNDEQTVPLKQLPLVKSGGYIDGTWRQAEPSFAVTDPATGEAIATVDAMDANMAEEAVAAAWNAFGAWAALLPQDRSLVLKQWHAKIVESREQLVQIMVAEQGKPISEARGEIDYAASFVEFYAEEAKRANVEGITSHMKDAEVELWREPIGVVALITPWNFPSAMVTRKAAAALAAGCTIVAHPSQETPLSALALAQLAHEAGVPAGVFNVLPGDAKTVVTPWCSDTRVRALSFTGSTEVGRLLYRQCAGTVKRLVLELGGHAPFIVFADADLDRAVSEAIAAKFATSGQDCLGANRMFIAREIYSEFCKRFIKAACVLTVDAGKDDPDIGPLMHERLVQKQEAQVSDAMSKGARLALGGKRHSAGSLFFEPTVLVDVPDSADIMREETFGPVAALTPFDSEDEVVRRANDTEYGLVAYVHTQNPKRIYRMSRALEFGMVAINRTSVTGPPIPFGGVKQSGLGREGARHGLEEFTEIKYVCRDWS